MESRWTKDMSMQESRQDTTAQSMLHDPVSQSKKSTPEVPVIQKYSRLRRSLDLNGRGHLLFKALKPRGSKITHYHSISIEESKRPVLKRAVRLRFAKPVSTLSPSLAEKYTRKLDICETPIQSERRRHMQFRYQTICNDYTKRANDRYHDTNTNFNVAVQRQAHHSVRAENETQRCSLRPLNVSRFQSLVDNLNESKQHTIATENIDLSWDEGRSLPGAINHESGVGKVLGQQSWQFPGPPPSLRRMYDANCQIFHRQRRITEFADRGQLYAPNIDHRHQESLHAQPRIFCKRNGPCTFQLNRISLH